MIGAKRSWRRILQPAAQSFLGAITCNPIEAAHQ
jgi:hypothetical protein